MGFRLLPHWVIFSLLAVWIGVDYGYLWSSTLIPSEDLPAHLSLSAQLRDQLLSGRIVFYDSTHFSGWSAFAYYGFLWSLLVALLSFPLSLFSESALALSTNLLLMCGLQLFPLLLYKNSHKLLALCYPRQPRLLADSRLLLAVIAASMSLWFFSHDGQFYGLGSGAFLIIGLAPQLLGMLLLLQCSSSLLSLLIDPQRRNSISLCLCFALLLLSHLQTAAYFLVFVALLFCFEPKLLRQAILPLLLALALCALWLLPLFSSMGSQTLPDPYPPQGDFLALLFRYPLKDLFQSLQESLPETFSAIQFFPLLFLLAVALLAFHPEIRRARFLRSVFLALLTSVFLLQSSFLAASLPFAFHYYRFLAYACVLTLIVFSCTLCVASISRDDKSRSITVRRGYSAALLTLSLAACISALRFPSLESIQAQSTASQVSGTYDRVIAALQEQNTDGRVFVEYLNDYTRFPYLSGHLLESRIPRETNRAVINGTFVESALRFRFVSVPASLLGASVFSPYLIFSKGYEGNRQQLLEQLQQFGIDSIIAGNTQFKDSLDSLGLQAQRFGPLSLYALSSRKTKNIRPARKTVLGYYDPQQRLPFYLLAFYFAARSQSLGGMDLLELDSLDQIPDEVSVILSSADHLNKTQKLPGQQLLVPLSPGSGLIDHYRPDYELTTTIRAYRRLARTFDAQRKQLQSLLRRSATEASAPKRVKEVLHWDIQTQTFTLSGLSPGELYLLDYSWSPFFRSSDCMLYRANSMQLAVRSRQEACTVSFRFFSISAAWIGLGISAIAVFIILYPVFRRSPGKGPESRNTL